MYRLPYYTIEGHVQALRTEDIADWGTEIFSLIRDDSSSVLTMQCTNTAHDHFEVVVNGDFYDG